MNLYTVLTAIIVVGGAVLGVVKWQKVKNGGQIGLAFLGSIAGSVSPTDDTPNRLTPAEIAEAFEKAGEVGKNILKDT